MMYFKFHIGDYMTGTSHLTPTEHGYYLKLILKYMEIEAPLPDDMVFRWMGARSEEEQAMVSALLKEFFQNEGGYWRHRRCDQEIMEAQRLGMVSRENGARGGRPKKESEIEPEKTQAVSKENPAETQQVIFENPERTQKKANHKPITNNHITNKPINTNLQVEGGCGGKEDEPPECTPPPWYDLGEGEPLARDIVFSLRGTAMFASWSPTLEQVERVIGYMRAKAPPDPEDQYLRDVVEALVRYVTEDAKGKKKGYRDPCAVLRDFAQRREVDWLRIKNQHQIASKYDSPPPPKLSVLDMARGAIQRGYGGAS